MSSPSYQEFVARGLRPTARPADRVTSAGGLTPSTPATLDETAAVAESRLRKQLEQLRAAANAVSFQLDTQMLADTVAAQAVELLACQRSLVGLVLDGRLQFLAARDRHGVVELPQPPDFAAQLQPVLRERRAMILDAAAGPRTALGVPIVNHQSHIMGCLGFFGRRRPGFFHEDDLRAAQCLADLASTAFDRARTFDRLHEWSNSLETLLAFNAAVNQHLPPDALLRRLVQHAVRFLKSDGGMAGLAIPASGGASVLMKSTAYFHDGAWIEQERDWLPHQGTPGTVLECEFPHVANSYLSDPLHDAEVARKFGVFKSLCVPIKNATDKVVGFFELHRGADGEDFSWQDAAFLESLGNTAAVSIENAQLLQSLETKQQQVRALSAAHVDRLERERLHISRELHDETGQMLIGMKLSLQMLARAIPQQFSEAHQEIDHLRSNLRESAIQLRDLAKRLRPPTLDELGFENSLQQLVADFASHGQTRIRVETAAELPRLRAEAATALYRIAQEALTNIFRHADATEAWLRLSYDGLFLEFTIEDNGRGFDVQATVQGLGLLGMQERVAMMGGKFHVTSDQAGTGIQIKVPIDA